MSSRIIESIRAQPSGRTPSGQRADATTEGDRAARRLSKACEYAESNFHEQLSLARIAKVAGYEQSYFSRLFRSRFGIGFPGWLRDLRISHAIRLLRESPSSIADIAHAVGYRDLSTFERHFRKSQGVAPYVFRRTHGLSNVARYSRSESLSF